MVRNCGFSQLRIVTGFAKLARQRYGVETKVFAAKDQLFNPATDCRGWRYPQPLHGDKHYMTLYCAELDYAAQQRVIPPDHHGAAQLQPARRLRALKPHKPSPNKG